ncbi:MAG: hemerythrin domain-containing protein [Vitreoscilla sp.]
MYESIRILRDEHVALASVLRTLLLLLGQARDAGRAPDLDVLRAILFYVAEFPEKRHHRKESEYLFPKLRALSPMSRPVLDRLDEDHRRGEFRIRELAHALTAYEQIGESRRAAFELAARQYVDFYLTHMALEEREIIPLALDVLSPADWAELDVAMACDPDPLAGQDVDSDYQALLDRIVYAVPPPLGLGKA